MNHTDLLYKTSSHLTIDKNYLIVIFLLPTEKDHSESAVVSASRFSLSYDRNKLVEKMSDHCNFGGNVKECLYERNV